MADTDLQFFAYVPAVPGVVANVLLPPAGHDIADCVHPSFVASMHPCGAEVRAGWIYDGTSFEAPPAAAPPATPAPLTFLEFLALFTPDEQAAIVGSADTKVKIFLMMATGATYIDLADPQTKAGIAYFVAQKLLTQDRAGAVLGGVASA